MKIEYYKKKMEDLGFAVFVGRNEIEVIDVDFGTIAIIANDIEMQMSNNFHWWYKLDDDIKEIVFKLTSELTMTRISDR